MERALILMILGFGSIWLLLDDIYGQKKITKFVILAFPYESKLEKLTETKNGNAVSQSTSLTNTVTNSVTEQTWNTPRKR